MENENFKIEFIVIEPIEIHGEEAKPIVHYKNSRRNKTKITLSREEYEQKKVTWCLQKYIGEKEEEWGFPQSSEQKLTDIFTTEKIVDILNQKNVFNFDYSPSQNDKLYIALDYVISPIKEKYSRPYIGQYISFLFDNGMWTVNQGYEHLHKQYINLKEGIIKHVA